jgi:UDP-N-acetylglucosamine 1-carboxyvinyltransferase
MLAACLLTEDPVTLEQVPDIEDVRVMLALLEDLGATVNRNGSSVTVEAAAVDKTTLDAELCRRVRSSLLLAGPLAARHGAASFFPPGGDVIGRRRLDTHFLGFRALGMEIEGQAPFTIRAPAIHGAFVLLDEASVTATENIMMAATLAEGETTLFNAACEPHVQDLGYLLQAMGADISGIGTNRLTIRGVERLHGATGRVSPDHIEVASFLAAAAATGGSITINHVDAKPVMQVIERGFEKLGITWHYKGTDVCLPANQKRTVVEDFGGSVPKIEDGVWPMFPSDLMSVAIVLATQTAGSVLFFEKLFESRMYFVDDLISMGAEIIQCDPHRVVVVGPSNLHANRMTSPDIRAGMALVIAALCADGESVIENAQIIDRGYERIETRLRSIGAEIVRTD